SPQPSPLKGRGDDALSTTSIAERVMVKHDRFFAVSARDGSIRGSDRAGDGLWLADTRILSEYLLLIGGIAPVAVSVVIADGSASFELAAADLRVSLVRYLDGGLHDRITIFNRHEATVEADLELVFASDFAAMLLIRGIAPELQPPVPALATETPDGLVITRALPGQSS